MAKNMGDGDSRRILNMMRKIFKNILISIISIQREEEEEEQNKYVL